MIQSLTLGILDPWPRPITHTIYPTNQFGIMHRFYIKNMIESRQGGHFRHFPV